MDYGHGFRKKKHDFGVQSHVFLLKTMTVVHNTLDVRASDKRDWCCGNFQKGCRATTLSPLGCATPCEHHGETSTCQDRTWGKTCINFCRSCFFMVGVLVCFGQLAMSGSKRQVHPNSFAGGAHRLGNAPHVLRQGQCMRIGLHPDSGPANAECNDVMIAFDECLRFWFSCICTHDHACKFYADQL